MLQCFSVHVGLRISPVINVIKVYIILQQHARNNHTYITHHYNTDSIQEKLFKYW